jgi:GxxExxY protein
LLKTGGCNSTGEVPEVVPWKDVFEKQAQILFNRVNKAQLLTYLKLSGLHLGLLLNFNVPVMRDGIIRIVNELKE